MVHLLIFKNIICWLIHIFRWFFFLSKKQQTASSLCLGFPGSSAGKESACNAEDPGSIPGSGRAPGEGIGYPLQYFWVSLVAQSVNNLPAMQETWIRSLGWEDQSLGWRRAWQLIPVLLPGESPRTEEPGGLQFMGLQTVGHDWATKHSTKAIIAWEILWMEKPGWLQSMGSQKSDKI